MSDTLRAIPRQPQPFNRRPAVQAVDVPEPPPPIADARAEPPEERAATEPAPRPAVTFTIHALLDDFPFDVQFTGTADQLSATIARLRTLGAIPPTPAARAAVAAEQAREAPVCKYHGTMKESAKAPGTWYCSRKMGDGSYCQERA